MKEGPEKEGSKLSQGKSVLFKTARWRFELLSLNYTTLGGGLERVLKLVVGHWEPEAKPGEGPEPFQP